MHACISVHVCTYVCIDVHLCNYLCVFVAGSVNDYYLGFFHNYIYSDRGEISIILISAEINEVPYSIEAPSVGYFENGTILAGVEVILKLPTSLEVSSLHHQDKGIYLMVGSNNVMVLAQSLEGVSSDSFLALPTIRHSAPYVYYGISVPRAVIHSAEINSSVLIVGTENNTTIRLTVTQSVYIGVSNATKYLIPGKEYSFVINRLQTVLIASLEDLTGTKIVADQPVSVLSGHDCGNVPSNVAYCSHLIEQIPPTALWGKVYYITPLAGRKSHTIKILAAYNSTNVDIYCNNTMELHTINEGGFINITLQMNEHCAIYSNNYVLVVQFGHGGRESDFLNYGDPLMILVPATNWYLNKFDVSTIRKPLAIAYQHHINIIVKEQYYQPNRIYLIAEGVSRSLATQQWIPIQVNNTIEAYATQVNITEGVAQVYHTNPAAQMMTFVYGFAIHDGYGHIGGFSIPKAEGCQTINKLCSYVLLASVN